MSVGHAVIDYDLGWLNCISIFAPFGTRMWDYGRDGALLTGKKLRVN